MQIVRNAVDALDGLGAAYRNAGLRQRERVSHELWQHRSEGTAAYQQHGLRRVVAVEVHDLFGDGIGQVLDARLDGTDDVHGLQIVAHAQNVLELGGFAVGCFALYAFGHVEVQQEFLGDGFRDLISGQWDHAVGDD